MFLANKHSFFDNSKLPLSSPLALAYRKEVGDFALLVVSPASASTLYRLV
jgi:hypothetical protein